MSIAEKIKERNIAQELLSGFALQLYMLKGAKQGFNESMGKVKILAIYEHFGDEYDWEIQLGGEEKTAFIRNLGDVKIEDYDGQLYEYWVNVGTIRFMCLVDKEAAV